MTASVGGYDPFGARAAVTHLTFVRTEGGAKMMEEEEEKEEASQVLFS